MHSIKTLNHLKGVFKYSEDSPSCLINNNGDFVGYIDKRGYWIVTFKSIPYRANRVVYFLFNEDFGQRLCVDHFDKIKHNNKINNLRLVSHDINMKNKKLYKNNTFGINGLTICIKKSVEYMRATITINGKLNEKYFNISKYKDIDEVVKDAVAYISSHKTNDFTKGHGYNDNN